MLICWLWIIFSIIYGPADVHREHLWNNAAIVICRSDTPAPVCQVVFLIFTSRLVFNTGGQLRCWCLLSLYLEIFRSNGSKTAGRNWKSCSSRVKLHITVFFLWGVGVQMPLNRPAKEHILRATCLCPYSKNVNSLEMTNGKGFLVIL